MGLLKQAFQPHVHAYIRAFFFFPRRKRVLVLLRRLTVGSFIKLHTVVRCLHHSLTLGCHVGVYAEKTRHETLPWWQQLNPIHLACLPRGGGSIGSLKVPLRAWKTALVSPTQANKKTENTI